MHLQFKVQLAGVTKPPVWRRVSVPASYTFMAFHDVIQAAMGWHNAHLFMFSPRGFGSSPTITQIHGDSEPDDLDAATVILSAVFTQEGQKFVYTYDFGDDWTHALTLEKITDEASDKPVLLTGKGACPPEDCGGPWGYESMKQVLANPKDPEHKDMKEWLGMSRADKWDAAAFDLADHQEVVSMLSGRPSGGRPLWF